MIMEEGLELLGIAYGDVVLGGVVTNTQRVEKKVSMTRWSMCLV